jgi:hypothetical protein
LVEQYRSRPGNVVCTLGSNSTVYTVVLFAMLRAGKRVKSYVAHALGRLSLTDGVGGIVSGALPASINGELTYCFKFSSAKPSVRRQGVS